MKLNTVREIVQRALREDVGNGDITTDTIVPEISESKARIYAREKGVVAGLDIAIEVFRQLDRKIRVKKFVKDGERVRRNQPLLELEGRTRALLTGERTALNFLQHLSGVATLTRKYVDRVKPFCVKIFDTRKTIPGLRILEKYAVRMGGGHNHRMGLYEMAMLKDNHLKIGSKFQVQNPVKGSDVIKNLVKGLRKRIPEGMKIEMEARDLNEVRVALESGVDIIMLDNMTPAGMRKAVEFIRNNSFLTDRKRPVIEASGNVGLHNVRAIAKTGVDWISIGRLTHSAPALDISLEILK